MALLSWWWPLSPWLSPAAAWFIFFNAVVGAIAVMSTSAAQAQAGGAPTSSSCRRRLCRSGSSMVLDRLRSLFVFPAGQLPIEETTAAAASASQRCSPDAEAAPATQVCAPERSPQAVAATTVGETPAEEEEAEAEEEQGHDECISLDEAYARAQRHRAKPLASAPSPPAAAEAGVTAAPAALPTEHKEKEKPAAKVVADRRRVPKKAGPGEAAVVEGKAEVNARAELFIRRFREDLKLQRLNSIPRHTHHALGSPTPTAAAR